MTRAERRTNDRIIQKEAKTVKKFIPKQLLIADKLAQLKAKEIIHKADLKIFTCEALALMESGIGGEIAEIIVKRTGELMDTQSIEQIEKEIVKMKSIKVQTIEIFKANKDLIRKDMVQKVLDKFPGMSRSSINAYFTEWKSDQKEVEEVDHDVSDALEKIADIIGTDNKEEIKQAKEVLKKADNELKAAGELPIVKATENSFTQETKNKIAENFNKSKEHEEPLIIKEVMEQKEKPKRLAVQEMSITLASEDNRYTLTKDKMEFKIGGDLFVIKNDTEYAEYLQSVNNYFNQLLDEAAEAFTEWMNKCRKVS